MLCLYVSRIKKFFHEYLGGEDFGSDKKQATPSASEATALRRYTNLIIIIIIIIRCWGDVYRDPVFYSSCLTCEIALLFARREHYDADGIIDEPNFKFQYTG